MLSATLILAPFLYLPALARSQAQTTDLASQTLEQLSTMEITVSSAARKNENLWLTPAAVYIISKEDIAQSAASTIPELLRVVPGMQVGQINASSWAVSARGFNGENSSKLLVLIDGRTVYSEIYSGAHWDQIDLPLEMIERIEVIRGPGAAVWGTNAVNGVVNIITKAAKDDTGLLVSAHVGRIDNVATVKYDGPLGSRAQYRIYANYLDRGPMESDTGDRAFDGGGTWRTGARLDWQKTAADFITTSADIYSGNLKNQLTDAIATDGIGHEIDHTVGGFILSRWQHESERYDTALQVYYDDQSRNEVYRQTSSRTLDFDFQRHQALGNRHDIVWGSEVRFTADHFGDSALASSAFRNYLVNGFFQDEIALVPRRLTLTLGTKIQMGTLAGFQLMPSARLLFSPTASQSIWAAVSRAAVAPSLEDRYSRFNLDLGSHDGLPAAGLVAGSPDFKTETLIAYEAGYRKRFPAHLALDVAGFFNNSDRIASIELQGVVFLPRPSPHTLVTFIYGNDFRAKSGGVETGISWKPIRSFSARASHVWLEAQTSEITSQPGGFLNAFNAPRNTYTGSASWALGQGWSIDGLVSHVGSVPIKPPPGIPAPPSAIPAYTRLDLHIARKFKHGLQLSAGGTNLLSPRHLEVDSVTGYVAAEYIPRSASLSGTWTF